MTSMKTMMVILMITLFGLLPIFQLAHAEVFKWVDEKGTVHLTDDPSTIPEKYRDKAQSKDEQECGLGEYETNVFMMRYLGGGRSPLAPQCRDILKKCCNYSHREFADLVDKYAKNAKWEVIPGKIPGLLRMYCGQTEPDISSAHSQTRIDLWDQNGYIWGYLRNNGRIELWDQNGNYIWGYLRDNGRIELWDQNGNYIWGELKGNNISLWGQNNQYIWGKLRQ